NDEYYTLAIADNAQQFYVANVSFTSAAKLDNPAYPNGVVEIDFYKAGGSSSTGADTAQGVAADINANLATLNNPELQLEYRTQIDEWYLGIDLGAGVSLQSAVNTLVSYLPNYIIQNSAGLQDPAAGGLDLFGDGTVTYVYTGFNASRSVAVMVYAYEYNGETIACYSVFDYAAS
ncbi:MAG: hypothetical protein V3G53_05210, partial [Candidatus Enteromonas sp.]